MYGIGPLKYLKSLSLVVALAVCTVAPASPITFDLAGVASSAGTLTGAVEIDSVTMLVTSAQITLNDALAGNPEFTSLGSETIHNGVGQSFIGSESPLNNGGELKLYYDTTSFGTGSGILDICLQGVACGYRGTVASDVLLSGENGTGGPVYLTAGELDPVSSRSQTAATPEPPSLILLGTGIVFGATLMSRFSGRRTEPEQS